MAEDAGEVRAEDSFAVDRLAAWLRETADPSLREQLAGVPTVQQFRGGASNLTYRLSYPDLRLILRRPPCGTKAAGAHDMGREYRIQQALAPVFGSVPRMVALGHADDDSGLGQEFYVMTEVVGAIPRRDLPFTLTPEQTEQLCRSAFGVLVDLHRVDLDATGLASFGKGAGYVQRQVNGWTERLARATTDDVGDWSDITGWLAAVQPKEVAHCLIHNDFRLDNLVFSEPGPAGQAPAVVGVLDWEMATIGDPLMDLGGALAYWVTAQDDEFFQAFRRQPSSAEGMWNREQIVQWYCDRMGFEMTPQRWRFYEVFGLFRLAVIAQQIWLRFVTGQTTNPAYAVFGPAVSYLERRCRGLIAQASPDTVLDTPPGPHA